jgi:TonB-dependent SusC/RagA subfamily outer membrane receptor
MFRGVNRMAQPLLQLRLDAAFGGNMKLAHLTFTLALTIGATACTAERALSPQPVAGRSVATSVAAPGATQVPLLFVVDGVRLQRDQVPSLTSDQIAKVKVLKGNAALRLYGPDASYGVVVITTKAALGPRA